MRLFRVMEGASEPAAYAVCALQEYGFRPQSEADKVLYGIFDFGGGTTDFDFGTWQLASSSQRRYDYVITHFGAGGDRLLGGENLLELLAYSVFKDNEALLRKNSVQFTKPADADKYCGKFDGSEALISDSQQAKINQKRLAEELRSLWYGEAFSKESLKLNLYNTGSDNISSLELNIDVDSLKTLIRKRIDSGVENFFEAMKNAVTDEIEEGVDRINIFLAGNSSRSEVVTESFDYYRKKYEAIFADKLGIEIAKDELTVPDADEEDIVVEEDFSGIPRYSAAKGSFDGEIPYDDDKELFVETDTSEAAAKGSAVFTVYPPLGTEESDEIRKKMGMTVSNSVTRPIGKTGVAYGLLECRPGSRIKVVSDIKDTEEIKFRFYTGFSRYRKFELVTDRNIKYDQWIEFTDADEQDFELYYTDLPEAEGNQMPAADVSKKICRIEEAVELAKVYIRAVEPNVMEYCVAMDEEKLKNKEYISPPKKIVLE